MEEQTPQQPAPQQSSNEGYGQGQKQEGGDGKGMAYLAYIIFFIPLLTDAKDDEFVKYHVKQGLILFLSWIAISIINIIPILGQIIFLVGAIFLFVAWIMGLVNVSKGVKKPLPLIGKWGEKFNF